jgi:hypothetical protein
VTLDSRMNTPIKDRRKCSIFYTAIMIYTSVAEPHHFYAALAPAPAPGENFDAAPAPASTLLYSKANF